jgi:peptidoglycan/xylan/chitin deacetylase (PgdA/CDA1 family)
LVKQTLLGTGALALPRLLAGPRGVLVRYHSIQEDPEQQADTIGAGIIHSTRVFQRHMEILARRFAPMPLQELAQFAANGGSLPRRAVAVTFDDGYRDNLDVAVPILNRFGIPATFYVTVGAIDSGVPPWFCRLRHAFHTTRRDHWVDPVAGVRHSLGSREQKSEAFRAAARSCAAKVGDNQERFVSVAEQELGVEGLGVRRDLMLDWEQLKKIRQAGHSVGSHSMTHPNVAHVNDEQMAQELVESKRRLEGVLGEAVADFSYPHPCLDPCWNSKTLALTRQAGYKTAVITTAGFVRPGDELHLLRRVTAPNDALEFEWQLRTALMS